MSSFKKKKHIWSFWFYSLQGPFSVKICQKLAFSWLRKKAFLTSFGGKLDAGNAKFDITIMWEREWNTFIWFLNHFYVKKREREWNTFIWFLNHFYVKTRANPQMRLRKIWLGGYEKECPVRPIIVRKGYISSTTNFCTSFMKHYKNIQDQFLPMNIFQKFGGGCSALGQGLASEKASNRLCAQIRMCNLIRV